jgi:Photosynthetic reaction centre cytochrome C subunit
LIKQGYTKYIAAVAVGMVFCLTASKRTRGQSEAPQGLTESPRTAEQVYKNIQVLNGLPASRLDGVMYFMSASLGVGCAYCHTSQWDSDDKTAKLTTRRMIQMMRAINKENFSGNTVVNCYTCHRGQTQTATAPPANLALPPPDAGLAVAKPSTPLPSSDEIIDRYIRAIGGVAAIDKIKTRASHGTETMTEGMTAPHTGAIAVYQKAPNKLLIVRDYQAVETVEAFNGATGWIKDSGGKRGMSDRELAALQPNADFFRYLKIKASYPQTRTIERERLGNGEVYVVGATSPEGTREKLYFDAQTGFLVRKYAAFNTSFGAIPEVTDFDDYRDVSGVKLPFTIIWSRPPFSCVRRFTEVKINVEMKDADFQMTK